MIKHYINIHQSIFKKVNIEQINNFTNFLLNNIDKNIFCIGNGGGMANMNHIMIDMNKINIDNKRFKFISLNNIASITAIGNDMGFENIFSEQLKNVMNNGDILFAFSASGESPDILKSVNYVKSINNKVISITRKDSSLSKLSDLTIEVPIFNYQIIEDIHLSIIHYIRIYIEHLHTIRDLKSLNFINNDLKFIKNKLNSKIGFTCGAFDLLHSGHLNLLKDCKQICDYLIIGLHIDPSIERPNKNQPIQSLKNRMLLLNSIKYVDHVITYNSEEELVKLLEDIQPDIRIIGSDWKDKEITGKHLNIQIYWHNRDHKFSSTYFRNLYRKKLND
jgi:glycerol-3-phosphate cytidylyltransferase